MRRELQLQLGVETVHANHRALRRCHGCGNYERPFVEMDGIIRCERCAKKDEDADDSEKKSIGSIGEFGLIV
ncbi:MAG TPA: hypothetical protein VKS03_06035 [Thermoanaerobaculia bacterium]|nr:hypothetical protein [Thermoanaerobaculia bacterium]